MFCLGSALGIVSSWGHHTHLSHLNYLATLDFFAYVAGLVAIHGGALGEAKAGHSGE